MRYVVNVQVISVESFLNQQTIHYVKIAHTHTLLTHKNTVRISLLILSFQMDRK